MTSRNPTKHDPKPETTPVVAVAPKDEKSDKSSEIQRELTDAEIDGIAGGTGGAGAGKVKFNDF